MVFFGKPLNEVREQDLQGLVQQKVRERQTLEFKRKSYERKDEDIREMLRDVSAMANAYGGEILLGVETVGDGVASQVVGVPDGEREAERINSSCLSNIEERIRGLVTWPVLLSNGKHVIIIRIPQSLRLPHMITFKGLNQFWVRHDRQKSRMSVHEIRDACMRVEMLTTQVTEFLEKRLTRAATFCASQPSLTVSLTPLLVAKEVVNTKEQKLRRILQDCSLNDGLLPSPCITGLEVKRIKGRWLRLDRNGHLDLWEDLSGDIIQPNIGDRSFRVLSGDTLRENVLGLCNLGKAVYEHCGILEPPIVKLDMWNIGGVSLRGGTGRSSYPGEPHTWSSAHLNLEPMEVDSVNEPERVVKTVLDRLWEAFGFDEAPFYRSGENS